MRMIFHELIGMKLDTVFVFILKEQAIIKLFSPFVAEEPFAIVALPCDME